MLIEHGERLQWNDGEAAPKVPADGRWIAPNWQPHVDALADVGAHRAGRTRGQLRYQIELMHGVTPSSLSESLGLNWDYGLGRGLGDLLQVHVEVAMCVAAETALPLQANRPQMTAGEFHAAFVVASSEMLQSAIRERQQLVERPKVSA